MEMALETEVTAANSGPAPTSSNSPKQATDGGNDQAASSSAPVSTKGSSRSQSARSAKAASNGAAETSAAKETSEKEDRRPSQKPSKTSTSRSNRGDHDSGSVTDVEGKKFKKEPKDILINSADSASRSTPTANVGSTFAGYSASSYLQGLASLPHPYASLFAAASDPATAAAANAFLTASHFGYASSAPTDLSPSKDNGASSRNHSNATTLVNSLNQTDVSSLRQLITGYREAAALLSRTADELEQFLCTRK